jgi:hypothetical protein
VDAAVAVCGDGAGWKLPRVGGGDVEAPLLAAVGVVLEAGFGAARASIF